MAIPSFDELRAQAAALSQRKAESVQSNQMSEEIMNNTNLFVKNLMGMTEKPLTTYEGTIDSKSGSINPYPQPITTGGTLGQRIGRWMSNSPSLPDAPAGSFRYTSKVEESPTFLSKIMNKEDSVPVSSLTEEMQKSLVSGGYQLTDKVPVKTLSTLAKVNETKDLMPVDALPENDLKRAIAGGYKPGQMVHKDIFTALKSPENSPKAPGEKNKTEIDKLDRHIGDLGSVSKSLDVVKGKFVNSGSSSKFVNSLKSAVSKTPFVGNALEPEASQYNGLKAELTPQLTVALADTKQGIAALGKLEGQALPSYGYDQSKGLENITELHRQLAQKGMDALRKKISLGGELSSEQQSMMDEFANVLSQPTIDKLQTPAPGNPLLQTIIERNKK